MSIDKTLPPLFGVSLGPGLSAVQEPQVTVLVDFLAGKLFGNKLKIVSTLYIR
jgi:hypothetical protein